MKNIVIKLTDSELGDEIVTFKYNEKKYDYISTINLATAILYLDFKCATYKELNEECPQLTKRLYKKAMEVLWNGEAGVTARRFCEFMRVAFGWKYEISKVDEVFNVEYGCWAN